MSNETRRNTEASLSDLLGQYAHTPLRTSEDSPANGGEPKALGMENSAGEIRKQLVAAVKKAETLLGNETHFPGALDIVNHLAPRFYASIGQDGFVSLEPDLEQLMGSLGSRHKVHIAAKCVEADASVFDTLDPAMKTKVFKLMMQDQQRKHEAELEEVKALHKADVKNLEQKAKDKDHKAHARHAEATTANKQLEAAWTAIPKNWHYRSDGQTRSLEEVIKLIFDAYEKRGYALQAREELVAEIVVDCEDMLAYARKHGQDLRSGVNRNISRILESFERRRLNLADKIEAARKAKQERMQAAQRRREQDNRGGKNKKV